MHAFPTLAADLPSRFRAPGASSATRPSGTGARLGRARRCLRGLPSFAASSSGTRGALGSCRDGYERQVLARRGGRDYDSGSGSSRSASRPLAPRPRDENACIVQASGRDRLRHPRSAGDGTDGLTLIRQKLDRCFLGRGAGQGVLAQTVLAHRAHRMWPDRQGPARSGTRRFTPSPRAPAALQGAHF